MDSIICDENPLISHRAFCESERLADTDTLQATGTALTCQASISDAQRLGDSLRTIATDLVHGSNTAVQNRDLFIRTYGKLSENYDKLSILTKLRITSDNTSELETCHNFNIKTNIVTNALPLKQNKHFIARSSHNFIRCRSRILKRFEAQKINEDHRDREPSRIPVKIFLI